MDSDHETFVPGFDLLLSEVGVVHQELHVLFRQFLTAGHTHLCCCCCPLPHNAIVLLRVTRRRSSTSCADYQKTITARHSPRSLRLKHIRTHHTKPKCSKNMTKGFGWRHRRGKAQIPLGSSRLDTTRHDTKRSTCRAHAFWLCRACRTTRLDTLVSTRSTRRTCNVVSRRDEPTGIWA